MDVVLFKKAGYFWCDLSFEVIHDDKSRCAILKILSNHIDVRYNNVYVLDDCFLVRPMLLGMFDVQVWREFVVWVTMCSYALVDELYREKVPTRDPLKTAMIICLSLSPLNSMGFVPYRSMVQVLLWTILIPVGPS